MKILGRGGKLLKITGGKHRARRRRNFFLVFYGKLDSKAKNLPIADQKVLNIMVIKDKRAASANFWIFPIKITLNLVLSIDFNH